MRRNTRSDRFRQFKQVTGGASVALSLASIAALLARNPRLAGKFAKASGVAGLASLTPSTSFLKRAASPGGRKFSRKERAQILTKIAEGVFNATFLSSRIPLKVSVAAAAGLVATGRHSSRLSRRGSTKKIQGRR